MSEQTAMAGKLSGKLQEAYKNIETRFTERLLVEDGSLKVGNTGKKVVSAYHKIEDAVVGGYEKVEDTVVNRYKKVEGAFVEAFLEKKEGEGLPETSPPSDGEERQ